MKKNNSNYQSLKNELYNIYHFDLAKLIRYGKIIDNTLMCDLEASKNSLKTMVQENNYFGYDKKGYSQLFDQTIKALKNVKPIIEKEKYFEDIFVNIDFSNYLKEYNTLKDFKNKLLEIKNGIKLYINNQQMHIVDFLKSNSMSKNCCVYYINKEY